MYQQCIRSPGFKVHPGQYIVVRDTQQVWGKGWSVLCQVEALNSNSAQSHIWTCLWLQLCQVFVATAAVSNVQHNCITHTGTAVAGVLVPDWTVKHCTGTAQMQMTVTACSRR